MTQYRFRRRWKVVAITSALPLLLVAGFSSAKLNPTRHATSLTTVKVVMGFSPNVQFAPFYSAVKLGYYRAAGINVDFNYATEPDALKLLAEGSIQFVDSGGDEVLAAGAGGLPVEYVLTQYSRFPSALFFLNSSHIKHVADLKGKTIGIPAETGASYFGLLALLRDNKVPLSSVKIEPINYNQVADVADHAVDAAMGYAPNEPVELRHLGKKVGEFDVYRWANIAGAGVATSDSLIKSNPHLVRAFVQATLKGLRFTIHHPKRAFEFCKQSIPDFTGPNLQRAVLNRAITFWKPAGLGLGHMDPAVWRLTARVLLQNRVLSGKVTAGNYYTNRFVG
jgi:NitT/TauT family transport system substrate-binding protein